MDVFLGTVMSFGFDFPPRGWATCAGQLVSVNANQALFALIGTYYGGNGQTTFGLPNLQGRMIIGQGTDATNVNWVMGQTAGSPTTTLMSANLPSHTHTSATSIKLPVYPDTAVSGDPNGNIFAISSGANAYSNVTPDASLASFQENIVVGIAGSSVPINNMGPFQVINYCIALQGLFPSRN